MLNLDIIFETVHGSRLYGTSIKTSDMDTKGVHIPDIGKLLLGRGKKSTRVNSEYDSFTKTLIDSEYFTVHTFLNMLVHGNATAFEMLFAPEDSIIKTTDIWQEIRSYKDKFLASNLLNVVSHSRGYARRHFFRGRRLTDLNKFISVLESHNILKRLEDISGDIDELVSDSDAIRNIIDNKLIPGWKVCGRQVLSTCTVEYALNRVFYPLRDKYGRRSKKNAVNDGVDWKGVMHAVRILGEAIELVDKNKLTFPRPDAKLLKDIRLGKVPYEEVESIVDSKTTYLDKISLPKKKNPAMLADSLALKIYKNRFSI